MCYFHRWSFSPEPRGLRFDLCPSWTWLDWAVLRQVTNNGAVRGAYTPLNLMLYITIYIYMYTHHLHIDVELYGYIYIYINKLYIYICFTVIYVYCFFNVVSYYLSFAPFVVPDPKRTLGPLPPQRTLKKKKKTDAKKSTPETHKNWKIRLGWLFFCWMYLNWCVWSLCMCLVFSTENTGFYEFVCVVGSGLWMHTTSNTWEYAWRLLTRRMNNKMEPRNSLHCFLTEADQRYGSQHVLCAKNIVYIYISVAAENVKTCPSRDGCRHSGIKFRVARWFQSNFSLQTPPDIQVVVYIEIR